MIVYVIIAIIVIVNIYRNFKKEQNKPKSVVNQQRPPIRVNQSARNITPTIRPFSRNSAPIITEEVIVESESIENKSIIDYPSLENNYTNSNIQHQYMQSEDLPISVDEGPSEESIAFDIDKTTSKRDLSLNTTEDLKKAFIYSLIFERKY